MTFKEAVELNQKGTDMLMENPTEGLKLIHEADSACGLETFTSICFSCIHIKGCPWAPDPQEDEPAESCNFYEEEIDEGGKK